MLRRYLIRKLYDSKEIGELASRARNAALEEAADVAKDFVFRGSSESFDAGYNYACKEIADALLNLKTGVE